METVFVVLNYYELPHYYLNVFGGFSICFIITLYLQSYIFQFCSWHRVPIHYVLLSNIIALIDDIVKIPLSDLNMMRMYFVLLVMFTMLFIYQESKFEHLSDCAEQIVKHGKKLMHCLSELESKSGEHYMERYGKRRRGGMRDSDYDDEDYPRYY